MCVVLYHIYHTNHVYVMSLLYFEPGVWYNYGRQCKNRLSGHIDTATVLKFSSSFGTYLVPVRFTLVGPVTTAVI